MAIRFWMTGFWPRTISRKDSRVRLCDSRGQVAQRGMGLDGRANGRRIVFCRSNPRAQPGTSETPSPHSTSTKNGCHEVWLVSNFRRKADLPTHRHRFIKQARRSYTMKEHERLRGEFFQFNPFSLVKGCFGGRTAARWSI